MARVILHLDCDCFYAQVELQRLDLPPDTPLAVVQWGSALAVSYPARRFGVKRGDNVNDITRKAGDAVTVVTVETIGGAENEAEASNEVPPPGVDVASRTTKDTEKVSLARYRNASSSVFDAIASMLPASSTFERASIDEVFLDISAEVQRRSAKRERSAVPESIPAGSLPESTVVLGDMSRSSGSLEDESLLEGSRFAAELRSSVLAKTGYTMSAGVASNKMLAKYASACNKPNKQTIVLPCAVEGILASVPISAFRGCGGKIGKIIMDLGFETAAAVRDGLSLERLEAAVGPRHARFLWGICRGMDDSEVVQRQKAKTLLAAKNFESSHRVDAAVSWLRILAQELVERMSFEEKHHNRFPRTLTCTFRLHCRATSAFTNVSRAHAMPGPSVKNRAGALVDIAHGLLVKTIESGIDYRLPINFVGLTGSNFSERAVGKSSIANFLGPRASEPSTVSAPMTHAPSTSRAVTNTARKRREVSVSRGGARGGDPQAEAGGIASYFAVVPKIAGGTAVTRSKEESDILFSRRQQEAADLALARRLARGDLAAPRPKKARLGGRFSMFSEKEK